MICPRCKRESKGWPIKRPDVCSPKDWVYCIRNLPEDNWAGPGFTKRNDESTS